MGRIVTIEGRAYEIPNARYTIPFTDVDGKYYEFDQYLFYNPLAHKAFGFTTILSVLKWWYKNREEFLPLLKESVFYDDLRNSVLSYFDYVSWNTLTDGDLELAKDSMRGHLRKPSLKFFYSGGLESAVRVLYEADSDTSATKVELAFRYCGQVEVIARSRLTESPDKWSKRYNYSFKMNKDTFNWFRSIKNENSVMFGMELEISTKLSREEIQDIVQKVEPKQEPFFIFKQDSSIRGKYINHVELVTVPCTPRYLRTHWKIFFQKIERLCKEKGLNVDDVVDTNTNLTNGLHIHVSRDSFLDEPHYNKFLTSWNQWNKSVVNLFNTVSSRPSDYTKNGYCRISSSHDGLVLARRLKGLRNMDRMCVAHNRSGATVEVRLFQGIFDLAHVMRCISFTEAVFEFSQEMGYSNFDAKFVSSMSQFVNTKRKYASLYSVFEK